MTHPNNMTQSDDIIYFNDKEKEILDMAVKTKENIFLHGPAGTGKTTLIKEISSRLKEEGKEVAMTATTGAAAVNIKGSTLHRFAGIGLGNDDKFKLYKRVMSQKKYIERWRSASILIIDEVSMLGGELFDKIDFVARKVRKRKEPMGNLQIIISGDLLQLPPIKDKWIFESETWKTLNLLIFNLTESKRYEKDDYFEMLLRIRENKQTKKDIMELQECVQKYEKVEDEIEKWEIKPTILYSRRMDVDYFNQNELDKLQGMAYEFEAIDDFEFKDISENVTDQQKQYYKNILNDAIPEKIFLKIGAQVMLRKNIDIDTGLINGSRGVVLDINEKSGMVKVKFLNGVMTDIDYEQWEIDDADVFIIRQQLPLILAWSFTIHKSQGATLDFVICDLGFSVFSYSQAYVALSRVRDIKGLYLTEFESSSIRTDPTALKFVQSIVLKPQKITKIIELEFIDDADKFFIED